MKGQEISPELKLAYLQILTDSVSYDQFYALHAVIDNNIVDAKDVIEQKFWQFTRSDQTLALEALLKFQSNLTLEYANGLIDTLDVNPDDYILSPDSGPDVLYEKVKICDILFQLNDFSKFAFVFELIERDSIKEITDVVIDPLIKIMQNVPAYSEVAKNILIDLVYNSNDLFTRSNALIALEKTIGIESLPILLQSFQSDSSDVNRFYILNEYLSKYSGYIDLSSILKERIYNEPAGSLRLRMAKILLYGPGGISNYNFVKNYINDESDEIIKDAITSEVEENVPRLFYEDSTLAVIIDSLISVTNQVHIINWLGDLTFSNELKNILTTAKTNLQNGDSLACRVQVKVFQDLVDNVYKDSLNSDSRFVTIEGWKFLYWNAQYILDRLPSPPVIVNADIEVIIPAMSLVNPGAFTMEVKGTGFTTNSIVYFNGNARATTFVSDSTLTAQILSTDVSTAGNYPVWVTEGTTNSDTLTYRVVSTLPQPVRPVLECVTNNGDGTYTAYFGYKNDNTVSVYIPAGSKNKFTPTPQDRGQTKVFLPGREYRVFTVNFNGSNLVWTLNGRTSTASSNSAPCN